MRLLSLVLVGLTAGGCAREAAPVAAAPSAGPVAPTPSAASVAPTPTPTPTPTPAPTAPAIAELLDDWHDAAARADEERYFAHFAAGAVFMGTDATERWTLQEFRAYAHPHFAKGKAWSFRAVRREVTYRGDVAWFDEDLDTPNMGPARGSGVVVREADGTWRIAHYNLALTIPNEKMKEVKALVAAPAH